MAQRIGPSSLLSAGMRKCDVSTQTLHHVLAPECDGSLILEVEDGTVRLGAIVILAWHDTCGWHSSLPASLDLEKLSSQVIVSTIAGMTMCDVCV
jgi:hypothetical protein